MTHKEQNNFLLQTVQ